MAPRHYLGAVVKMYTTRFASPSLSRRTAPSNSVIVTIIAVSVVSTLLLATAVFLAPRMWKQIKSGSCNTQQSEKPQDQGTARGRKQSDWARKNSDILWSLYIEEEDLKAQFAASPKSRHFSIGSISTVDGRCPLDRRPSHASPLGQHKPVEDNLRNTDEFVLDMRIRTPYEHTTTPTKTLPRLRAMSQPSKPKHTSSFEEVAKRKQSLPAPRMEASVNWVQTYG